MEAISVPELVLHTSEITRPDCLSDYDGQWGIQLGSHNGGQVCAQILVGVDMARVFPVSVVNEDGSPVQTKHARLVRSMLSGRYLLFGSAEPKDELYHASFPIVDDGLVSNNYLGVEAQRAQLEGYHSAYIEDIITTQ